MSAEIEKSFAILRTARKRALISGLTRSGLVLTTHRFARNTRVLSSNARSLSAISLPLKNNLFFEPQSSAAVGWCTHGPRKIPQVS